MRWRLLAGGVVLLALTSGAGAGAQSEAEQRQACMGDAMRFCAAAIPDRRRVGTCLAAKRASLSPACRAMMDCGGTPRPSRRG